MDRGAVVCGKDAMFLKRLERRKNGKGHTYWALVESIRTVRGSRHRVVAYLGELKKSEKNGWAQLGRRLDRKARPQPALFDPPRYDEPPDDEPVLVKLKGIRLERLREFGDVWLALGLWRTRAPPGSAGPARAGKAAASTPCRAARRPGPARRP